MNINVKTPKEIWANQIQKFTGKEIFQSNEVKFALGGARTVCHPTFFLSDRTPACWRQHKCPSSKGWVTISHSHALLSARHSECNQQHQDPFLTYDTRTSRPGEEVWVEVQPWLVKGESLMVKQFSACFCCPSFPFITRFVSLDAAVSLHPWGCREDKKPVCWGWQDRKRLLTGGCHQVLD